MSLVLVHQGIALLVQERYGGKNRMRANAGAESEKDSMY